MQENEPSSSSRARPRIGNVVPLFAAHVRRIPTWQKLVLGLALVAGIAGILAGFLRPAPAVTSSGPTRSIVRTPGSGFANSGDTTVDNDSSNLPAADSSPAAPWYSRVGISLVVGFIFGWLLRTFLRLMAIVALIVAGLLGTLSHYHIVGSDLAAEGRDKYHEATSWVETQTKQVKHVVIAHVPSGAGAFVGVFMGMRKRR